MTTRLVIVDDQAMVRAGFAALLAAQPDVEVVGEASDGAEAVALVGRLRPDLVLMDVRMPVMDGLAAARTMLDPVRVARAGHQPRVLMLTTFDVDDYVYDALRAGASGFILKDAPASDLIAAVRVVAGGDALLAPTVTRRLIAEFARRRPVVSRASSRLAALTERETEVLRLVARGLSNQEIAAHLVVAEQTVKSHFGRVLAKLDLRDRAQAVVFAYESGLVTAGGHD
ncbi:DNA-binding response regulator [Actinoalloteichus sp. AHMU CJ021]|uniref:Two component transcriptional regulator, LuxR family n=1 Tax=Actinoalloteichus caeruleus DSM 43889 TaxID=1120930 RepID=A0ABT1JLU5_ACTCY|nr:response regulator transcription factor [Actinoalloteichus caeruleus]AUS79226.1 DNA-binding response regulator [Actinoalloteichus sp. AHMU CJ021]MCP2333483.1 two component transcriptional regulator, LuxR family [Actinoalloteichus caeruleus DSM 43889]